jgi:hypothetical protein
VPLHRSHGMVLAAMGGKQPALRGMWVIGSAEELQADANRRAPQPLPEHEAPARPRLVAAGGAGAPVGSAWVIRGVEDV